MTRNDEIRRLYHASGLTRAEFAKRVGVSWKTLDNWLRPESSQNYRRAPETALRLARRVAEEAKG